MRRFETAAVAVIVQAGLLAGCVLARVGEPPPPPPDSAEDRLAEIEIWPPPRILPVVTPARRPPPPAVPPEPPPPRVILLVPPAVVGLDPLVAELETQLADGRFDVVRVLTDDAGALAALGDADGTAYVVAVGSEAARIAIEDLGLPTVFCQVPDRDFQLGAQVYGVATMPPLDLQLRAWKQLDPSLDSIGLILGRDEYVLAAQARRAAKAAGLALDLQLAASDQEAVYHFKRMAPGVDGLWLLPDNSVLSPRSLKEMLDHAATHRIETLVFTPALLEWGALLSVTGTPANVAQTVADVVETIAGGDAAEAPRITPLAELEATVNRSVAERLGLHPPAGSWIVRSGDW